LVVAILGPQAVALGVAFSLVASLEVVAYLVNQLVVVLFVLQE